MKKRFIAAIIILCAGFFLWIFGKMIPDIYLGIGKELYRQGNFKDAYPNLKIAVFFSRKNPDARYYYVQTLLSLRPTIQIQKDLFKISQANLSDSADLIADRQLSKWKNQISYTIGQNYIEQVPFDNKIMRWDRAKFPLRVYIKNNSTVAPAYYQAEIKKAFLQWQKSSGKLVSFAFVDNEQDSDIDVSINSSNDMKKCTEAECKYTVAFTTPRINGDLLKRMDIAFYDSNNLGQPFSQREIYSTALHEIGHALGIMGHSYDKGNLMYMESGQGKIFENVRSDFQLISQTDLNTLNLLYKLIPDITNTHLSEYDAGHQFYAPIVMGSDEQISSRKLLEAQNYIVHAPDLPNGYIDLASAYAELHQSNKAIETLNKALSLCSNDSERFVVYYNFSVIYMQIKDWDDALRYANMAKGVNGGGNASSDIDGVIAMINYNRGDKAQAIRSFEDAVQKNPENVINAYNLATLYLREFNFPAAGRVLNRLIQANPEARSDSRIKRYGLIILLFR